MADRTDIRPEPDRNPLDRQPSAGNIAQNDPPVSPRTPGGSRSPQHPGATPDRSTIPGHGALPVARPGEVRRPLTQYATAQEIMGVYAPAPGEAMDPSRFEQATASYEEMRKAYPAQATPTRPRPGFALTAGDRVASEAQEIGGPTPAALDAGVGGNQASGTAVGDQGRAVGDAASGGGPGTSADMQKVSGGPATPIESGNPARAVQDAANPVSGDDRPGAGQGEGGPAPGDRDSPAGVFSADRPDRSAPGESPQAPGAPPTTAPA